MTKQIDIIKKKQMVLILALYFKFLYKAYQ